MANPSVEDLPRNDVRACIKFYEAHDITRDRALAMVSRAADLGDTLVAFYNEASATLCIG